jgi:hypothetical protein
MGAYDRFMQLVTEDGRESLVPCTQSPFRLLVDDDARREVIERVGRYGPSRGHRNPVKADSEDFEVDTETFDSTRM